jgi:hypothetical protein
MKIPIQFTIGLLLVGLLTIALLTGLLHNKVLLPVRNKQFWLKPVKKRCLGLGDDARKLAAVVVCNGFKEETARQVAAIFKNAYCAFNIHVVIVRCKHMVGTKELNMVKDVTKRNRKEFATTKEHLAHLDAFKGIERNFNLMSRVDTVTIPAVAGNFVAFATGARHLLKQPDQAWDSITFFGPCSKPCRYWDKTVIDNMAEIREIREVPAPIVLSSGLSPQGKLAHPTFPVAAFLGNESREHVASERAVMGTMPLPESERKMVFRMKYTSADQYKQELQNVRDKLAVFIAPNPPM